MDHSLHASNGSCGKKWTDLVHASHDENCNNFVQCYKTVNLKLKRLSSRSRLLPCSIFSGYHCHNISPKVSDLLGPLRHRLSL